MTGYNFVDISRTLTVFHVLVLYEIIMCVYLFRKQANINIMNWIIYSRLQSADHYNGLYTFMYLYLFTLCHIDNNSFIQKNHPQWVICSWTGLHWLCCLLFCEQPTWPAQQKDVSYHKFAVHSTTFLSEVKLDFFCRGTEDSAASLMKISAGITDVRRKTLQQ